MTKTLTYTFVLLLLCSLTIVHAGTSQIDIFKDQQFKVPSKDGNYIYETTFNVTIQSYRNATLHFSCEVNGDSYLQQINIMIGETMVLHKNVDNWFKVSCDESLAVSPKTHNGTVLISGYARNSTYLQGTFSLYITTVSEDGGGLFDFMFGGIEIPFLVFFILVPCIVLILVIRHRRHRED